MKILIVGNGVAGTALAGLLSRQGHELRVIDRTPGDSGAGYVLGLWPLGSRVLRMLGLYEAFEELSVPLTSFCTAAPDGTVLNRFSPEKVVSSLGEIRMIERSALVKVLALAVTDIPCQAPLTIDALVQDEAGVEVSFDNGMSDRFDLVIGCDGVNSSIRRLAFDNSDAVETDWFGWGWWISPEECEPHTMTEYWHPGKAFLATYPAMNVACAFAGLPSTMLPTPESRADLGKVKDCFAQMGGSAAAAVAMLDEQNQVFHDSFRTVVCERWVLERVALVGDAASAYFPYGGLGLGASMALESAAVLAEELSRADPARLAASLSFYEARRIARVRRFEEVAGGVVKTMLNAGEMPKPEDLLESQRVNFRVLRDLIKSPL